MKTPSRISSEDVTLSTGEVRTESDFERMALAAERWNSTSRPSLARPCVAATLQRKAKDLPLSSKYVSTRGPKRHSPSAPRASTAPPHQSFEKPLGPGSKHREDVYSRLWSTEANSQRWQMKPKRKRK